MLQLIKEYRLKNDGSVEVYPRDARTDSRGMHHLIGTLWIAEGNFVDKYIIREKDMDVVLEFLLCSTKDGGAEFVRTEEPLILSKRMDIQAAKKMFAKYLDQKIQDNDEAIRALSKENTLSETNILQIADVKEDDPEDQEPEPDDEPEILPFPYQDTSQNEAKRLLINYNERFKDAAPTMFRDELIAQTESCLIGRTKPNALLIGAAGVGKTKIVEDIARRIANQDASVPEQLLGCTIWELPLSNIVSGSKLVGDVERKANAILDFAQNPENNCILFIDEVHQLCGEGQSYDKIAQIFKPALARGDMKVIAATTLQESQDLLRDPAFNRRFTRLIVDEFTREQTEAILKQMQGAMFEHYRQKVALNDHIIHEIVQTADDFKTVGSHRPDNAITLMDRAMADAYIERLSLEKAKDPAIIRALEENPVVTLSRAQLRSTAMKIMTGNSERTEPDMQRLQQKLNVILGQEKAVKTIMEIITRDRLELYPRTRPLSLLFTGNSGVGKTEIAKILASELTDTKPIILNMTEYQSSASINRIIGSPVGYTESNSKQELPFDLLESNPYQVILLDEFEKADNSVQRLFMSAFEEGWIKTARGKLVDFSRAIIIATTNAGHKTVSEKIGFTQNRDDGLKESMGQLSQSFDPELLNRFSGIIEFNAISKELFSRILAAQYERDVADIKSRRGDLSWLSDHLTDQQLEDLIHRHYVKEFGARPVKKAVRAFIEDAALAHADNN